MFDIDHLYLCSYHYHTVDDSGAPVVTRHFDPTEENQLEKYYQNLIMEDLLTLLGDVENSMNSLYKSIDNDTELLTNISDLIPSADSDKHLPFNFGTLSEQIFRRTDYMTGKTGIGPFALNVTNQVLTYLYGVKFKSTAFTTSVGLDGLDHLVDTNGNYINSWLSGFINSHVDIIKDPYISKLNTNPFTYNMINLLIRAGWGEAAVWFVCQPIIRDMATAENIASSQYARDTDKDKTIFAAKEAAKKKAILKYMDEHTSSDEALMKYTHATDKDSILEKIRVVRKIRDNVELYKQIAMHPNAETVTVKGVTYNVKNEQQDVFYAWKSLEKYMLALSKLVQLTKIDTRKHGKNFMEIRAYLANYNAFFHPLIDDSVFDMSTLERLINNSWIEQKTRSAIEYPTKVLGGQTFNANSRFVETIVKWATILAKGNDGFVSNKMLNSLSRALQTAIKSLYIIQYAKEYLGYNDSYIAGLFVENKDPKHPGTMNNRLNRLLDAVRNNPKYNRLKTNMLLNQITTVLQENDYTINGRVFEKPKFITVSSTVTNSKVNEIAFREAWLDLLNDEDKFVRGFARDLIIYSFLTSGEYNGWNKLFKYVPIQWISGEVDTDYHQSFAGFVLSALDSNCQGYLSDKMLDDIISNNFNDYTLVKKLNKVDSDTREINYVLSEDKNVLIGAKVSARDKKNIREYVAITKSDYRVFNNAFSNDVYKLVGSIEHVEGGKKYYIPVYVRIPKRGYHNNKKYDIYEYGWNFRYAENYTGLDDTKPYSDISKKLEQIAKSFDFTKLTDDTAANAISKIIQANDDPVITQPQPVTSSTENPVKINIEQTTLNEYTGMFDDETMLRIYQAWEYMEDSINTTPRTDIKTENYIVTSINGESVDRDMGKRMYYFVKDAKGIAERDSKDTMSVPYSEYKNVVSNIERFDDVRSNLIDYGFKNEKVYGKYNKSTRTLTISTDIYDLYKLMSENQDVIQSFADIINKTENRHYIVTAEDVLLDILDEGTDLFDNVEREVENYSQLDLFQDTAYSDMTQNEQQEAEELMKRCKGGE